jgi:hypothetical protein
MRLDELLEQIVLSEPSDWHVISGPPSYRDKFAEVSDGKGQHWIDIDSHDNVAAFIPNVSVTMAWGQKVNDDFQEPWANKFPDRRASSHHVDVFYNNALVYRDTYVLVDGGRAHLPLPLERYEGRVPFKYRAFIALVDRLTHVSQFPSYFERAGLQSVDAPWPFQGSR